MIKLEKHFGPDFDYGNINYDTVEFEGKVRETGVYTDKPKQQYISTMDGSKIDKPVPYIRIDVDKIYFDNK